MRLRIGLPCYDSMKPETAMCLALAVRLLKDEPEMTCKTGPYVHWHREHLLLRAMEKGDTHLMMIDADLVFPADGINRLIERDVDIAYGSYNRRNHFPLERLRDPAGFMLINVESIKNSQIERDYFPCPFGTGEDVSFLRKARLAGLKIVCDETLKIGHKGEYTY